MLLSIFTPLPPSHGRYVEEAYDSLCHQTYKNWEWVLVPNLGASIPDVIATDERVKVYPFTGEPEADGYHKIGALKKFACGRCHGGVFVELDADDLLTPNALESIHEHITRPGVQFVYSNSAKFDEDWQSGKYGEYWGWRSRTFDWKGHELNEMIAWPPGPQMMRRVEWAPNHVRAWRASAYRALGGHNEELAMGDDHELCCRTFTTYGAAGMKHIDECLYLYRVHGDNNCVTRNRLVQAQTHQNYLDYILPMAMRWAEDEGLRGLDLGSRFGGVEGLETVDLFGADLNVDLNHKWPFADDSVGVIRASHIFEHLNDPIQTMNNAYRALAPGGFLFCEVPSTDGRGAFQDPTHVSFWNENSFWYYTRSQQANYIPRFKGRFQASLLNTYFPSEWWKKHDIPVVRADLIALKPPYDKRPVGEVLI